MYETIILHECRNSSILANVSNVDFFQHPVPSSHLQHNKNVWKSTLDLDIRQTNDPHLLQHLFPQLKPWELFFRGFLCKGNWMSNIFFFEETKPAKYIQILLGLHCFGCLKLLIWCQQTNFQNFSKLRKLWWNDWLSFANGQLEKLSFTNGHVAWQKTHVYPWSSNSWSYKQKNNIINPSIPYLRKKWTPVAEMWDNLFSHLYLHLAGPSGVEPDAQVEDNTPKPIHGSRPQQTREESAVKERSGILFK